LIVTNLGCGGERTWLVAEPPRGLPRGPLVRRAERIGEFRSYSHNRTFAELVIDGEEDRTLRAVLVGMLREWDRPLGLR